MRRILSLLLAAGLAALGLAVTSASPGQAAGPLTGRIVDAYGTNPAVPGMTVRLRTVTAGGPGTVVDTDTTGPEGWFSLDAGPSPDDEYYVQVLAGAYQGGYVGESPRFVQPGPAYAATYGPHASLGTIGANPAFIRGSVVDNDTRRPVRGVRVTGGTYGVPAADADTTDRRGRFVLRGIACEDDCFLRLKGEPRGYETGYRGCAGGVVATWGDACAAPIGRIGRVRIDPL